MNPIVPMRYAFAVKDSLTGQWLGNKRFSYHKGKHDVYTDNVNSARLFNRHCDAANACTGNDVVVPFSLVEADREGS